MAPFDLSGASHDFGARFHLLQLLTCGPALNGNEVDAGCASFSFICQQGLTPRGACNVAFDLFLGPIRPRDRRLIEIRSAGHSETKRFGTLAPNRIGTRVSCPASSFF
jgi:hypothetical protein